MNKNINNPFVGNVHEVLDILNFFLLSRKFILRNQEYKLN